MLRVATCHFFEVFSYCFRFPDDSDFLFVFEKKTKKNCYSTPLCRVHLSQCNNRRAEPRRGSQTFQNQFFSSISAFSHPSDRPHETCRLTAAHAPPHREKPLHTRVRCCDALHREAET